jgi:hypothetical protein
VLAYRALMPDTATVERLDDSPLAARDALVRALEASSPRSLAA